MTKGPYDKGADVPVGPGKYGARAEALLREVVGELCVIITLRGIGGCAFDVAARDPALMLQLPQILRDAADSVERELTATLPQS